MTHCLDQGSDFAGNHQENQKNHRENRQNPNEEDFEASFPQANDSMLAKSGADRCESLTCFSSSFPIHPQRAS